MTSTSSGIPSSLPGSIQQQQLQPVDPVSIVQDSIDALALSLFEALRNVRDAVAGSSSSSSSTTTITDGHPNNNSSNNNNNLMIPMVQQASSAFQQEDANNNFPNVSSSSSSNKDNTKNNTTIDNTTTTTRLGGGGKEESQQQKSAAVLFQQAKDKLLEGLNKKYFPSRAYDMLQPDYEAFILSYLGGEDTYAKHLVERFILLSKENNESTTAAATTTTVEKTTITNENDSKTIDDVKTENSVTNIEMSNLPQSNTNITREEDIQKPSLTSDNNNNTKKELGEVGYEFRKEFDAGWFTGKVVEIRHLAENGFDRRCVYSDGDVEDLRLEDLQHLAKLDPLYDTNVVTNSSTHDGNTRVSKKPRLCIKLNISKTTKSPSSLAGLDETKSSSSKEQDVVLQHDNKRGDNNITSSPLFPASKMEYIQLLHDAEYHHDNVITTQLAANVLSKSNAINDLVANLPGMDRTRSMQYARINELIEENRKVMLDLDDAYILAITKRDDGVRPALAECTATALGLDEE